jgi:hypothetical protein
MSDEPIPVVLDTTPPAERKPVEDWARAKSHFNHPDRKFARAWIFNATRTREHWPRGAEVTEAEYDAAVTVTLGTQLG